MGDPLSIAASIAGLAALADNAFKYVYKYARAAKDAKTDVQSLSEEINDLASVLRVLGALAWDLEAERDKFDPTLRNHHLDHCRTTLNRVEKRVKKAADRFSKPKWESIPQQLKWPFSVSETRTLLADLSRHKATISTALAADTMRKLQLSLTKTNELGTQITAIGEVVRKIEINTLIDVNDHKQRILDYFMKTSPQPNLEMSIQLRHSTTGLWLTESSNFRYWLETPGSKLWLTGIPGAGKTVLAGSVIQDALTRAYASLTTSAAFFFCDYKDRTTWSPVNILGAICSQLARQKDEAFEILHQYYEDLHPPRGLAKTPHPDELRTKISQMSELFDQTIIVVDGLDECGDNSDDVVDVLMEVAEYSDDRVSMALFSRDHLNIRTRLGGDFEIIPIAARTEDVRIYVGAEIERRIQRRQLRLNDISMKEEIMETLVSRAKGMFRWVVCQLDYLCDCAHDEERRDALSKLPPDLPESYRRLLERVNRCSRSIQEMVKMCLFFIAFAGQELTILGLRQAISTPEVIGAALDSKNMISEEEISGRCSSLIRKSEDGEHFEFAHFSVQEFLEDASALSPAGYPCLQQYLISKPMSRSLLAVQCLRFVQLKNFERTPRGQREAENLVKERHKRYPFYGYAATKWVELTKDGFDELKVLNAAKGLFHPTKKPQFRNWAMRFMKFVQQADEYRFQNEFYGPPSEAFDVRFSPLHMAAALNLPEICSFLVDQGVPVNPFSTAATPIDLAFASVLEMPGIQCNDSSMRMAFNFLEYGAGADFLPRNERRNLTIEYLINMGARPSNQPLTPGRMSIFSIVCALGARLRDFTPIINLLSCNIVPRPAELKCFKLSLEDALHSRKPANGATDDLESSTFAILRYLNTISGYRNQWGRELGSIVWQKALENNFSYTDDPFMVDSQISMSEEALKAWVRSAILHNDAETVKRCIADDRFDKTVLYLKEGDVDTLLHLAAREGALEAFGALLDLGYNPTLANKRGVLPIYMCEATRAIEFLRVLKQFGFSASCSDTRGYTICHYWAADPTYDNNFLAQIFELDPKGIAQALLMKTVNGNTPLLLRLKETRKSSLGEERTLYLMELCSKIPDFWGSHDSILGAAVHYGSEKVLQHIRQAGVGFEAPMQGTRTPLHQLPATISMETVRWLLGIYADSVDQRVEGKLPAEVYITATLKSLRPPQKNIIDALISPTLLQGEGCALWEFTCALPSHFKEDSPKGLRDLMGHVFDTMLRLGAMQVYEEQTKQSGIVPLFSGILEAKDKTHSVSADAIRNILLRTKYWTAARQSHVVLKFSKSAAGFDVNLSMTRLLLEYGVDVHSQCDGEAIIEMACNADQAIKVCATAEGKMITQCILDHSNSKALSNVTSLDKERRGLLHRLATNENATNILWLVEALIERGIDVNDLTQSSLCMSALAYHVRQSSFQCAELLLKLGADPLAGGSSYSPTAIEIAIITHNPHFLKKLLDHATRTSSTLDWGRLMEFDEEIEGQRFSLKKANSLHCAALAGSLDCLKFLLNENLIRIDTSISAEGWTPLHISAYKGSMEVTKFLLSKGADIMAETNDGETPVHMAAKGNHPALVKLLIENRGTQSTNSRGETAMQSDYRGPLGIMFEYFNAQDEAMEVPLAHAPPLSQQQLRIFAAALADAVRNNGQLECERLIAMGCPIDIPLYEDGSGSALVLALKLSSLELAEWLLDHGASPLKSMHDEESDAAAVEIAAAEPLLNPLLPKLLTSYCAQGGDLVRGDDFPFHAALWAENIEGLRILLQALKGCIYIAAEKYQVTPRQAVKNILNRRFPADFGSNLGWGPTTLHVASFVGSTSAVSLLVKNGATIEITALEGSTPLMSARSVDMAEHLIKLGASTAAICRFGSLPRMIDWYEAETFSELNHMLLAKVPGELIRSDSRFPTPSTYVEFTTTDVAAMYQLGFDLTHEDGGGRSLMHCIICKDDLSGFVLNSDCGLLRTTPFPWHLDWYDLHKMAFLGSRFRDFQRKLSRNTFCRILNLEPSNGWSPLCRAVALDLIEVIANFLEMGAQIDFEGCPVGSAIMYASACGSLKVVKFLVRNGASLTYFGRGGFRSCFLLAGTEEVKSWLLCGRFTELWSIEGRGGLHEEIDMKPWSGIVKAGVRLYGKREKAAMGSMLDNAKRLWKARKYWEGKVVPVDYEIVQVLREEISQ